MALPIWLNKHGHPRPTRPCPKCGKDLPEHRYRFEHLRMNGWKPMGTMKIVNWCGHSQEFVAWPEADGYRTLVPLFDKDAA